MHCNYSADTAHRLTLAARALARLAIIGASIGFGMGLGSSTLNPVEYFSENRASLAERVSLLSYTCGAAIATVLLAGLYIIRRNANTQALEALLNLALRILPLSITAFIPLLFSWAAWQHNSLGFLTLVALFALTVWYSLRCFELSIPFRWERPLWEQGAAVRTLLSGFAPRLFPRLPLAVVCACALCYSLYFSYHTVLFHQAARTGFDMAIENNLMWNLVHGAEPLFKSSPIFGPTGTHFGNHATLFAFVMAPIYATFPEASTLLVIQSFLLGCAAIPLYCFGRRIVGALPACVVALAYLLYPAVHGANIFEFHYIPLGVFFLFLMLALFEARRDALGIVVVAITLSVREDVSAWVGVVGAYYLFSGKRPKLGATLAVVGLTYFGLMKFVIMPRYATGGGESFTFIFKDLIPKGVRGFAGVLSTVFTNPAFTLKTLLVQAKLEYLLALFLPLAFMPFRANAWKILFLPGAFFTLLSTDYSPAISIHFQYVAHWIAFVFPATLIALAEYKTRAISRLGLLTPLTVLCLTSVTVSYQLGSILQQNTSYGGPLRFTFGLDDVARERRDAVTAIMGQLPDEAKVSCSGFLVPQLSGRADAYSLTLGLYDAQYIAFPSKASDFIVDELKTVTRLIRNGEFGVVAVHPPFALAKRGAPTDRNADFLESLK